MAGDLNFSVQLRLLNEQFNNGINQARDKFTQYAQSVQRNVDQMKADTDRATTMLAGLNNISADRLTAEIRATADQLRQMGAGASLSGEQVEAAMQASAQQVIRLARQLEVARSEAARLNSTPATPAQIEQAAAKVNTLTDSVAAARAKVELLSQTNGTPAQITEAKAKVDTLTVSLAEARAEVKTLSQTNASPEDIAEAKAKVAALKNELGEARTEVKALSQTHATPADIAEAKAAAQRLGDELSEARLAAERLSQTGASPQEITEATASINRLEQELNDARSASVSLANELAGAMNRASTTADNARNAIYRMANVRVPETIRGEINQLNRALTDFTNNSGRPAAEIERVTRATQEQIRRLEAELRGLDQTQDRVSQGAGGLGSNINRLQGAFGGLQGLLAAAGLGIGVAEIIETADAFKMLEARIKLATGEGAAFITGFEGVKKIADETFSGIENTGELFARISQAGEELGMAQEQVLAVTRTINEAIKLSGGSAASADAAITQLIQGLQSGVVRGEEFNSIMEQAPRLAKAMADGLGVTRGELRALSQDGKLTSEVVINAIRSQGETIANEFGTLPLTVGNSLQVVKNQIFNFIGEIDKTLNQSSKLAEAISYIGDSLEELDPKTVSALTGAFESSIGAVVELANSIKLAYDTLNGVVNAIAGDSAEAAEQVGLITAALHGLNVFMGFVKDGFSAIGVAAGFVVASLYGAMSDLANIAASITFGDVSKSFKQTADDLQVKSKETWASAEQDVLDWESSGAQAIVNAGKTAKDHFIEVATESESAYRKMSEDAESTAEQQEAALVKYALDNIKANDNVISDKLRIELAEKNLQAVIGETGKVSIESAKEITASYLRVGESFAEVALKAQESGKSIELSLAEAIHKANTRGAVEDISNSLQALANQGVITGEQLALGQNIVRTQMSNVEAQIAKNMETFGDYAARVLAGNGNIITAELQHAASLENLAIQMDETGNVMITELDKSTIASGRTKEQIDELAGAVGIGLSKEFLKSSAGLDDLISGFDDLEKAGYDAGGALVNTLTEMTNKAKNTAELEYVIEKWNELGKEGKITGRELADGLDLSRTKLDELTDGINSVAEAYGVLGLKTREELAKQAGAYTEAYGIIKKDGQATAQQLDEAFEKTAKSNIASNNGVIDAVTKRMAAERGVTVAVDEQGRVTFEKMGQSKTANDKVTTSVNNIRTAYDGISSSAGSAGNAMVRAANDASSAYDKLQQKIKDVKEAQAVADERTTMQNLRIYGKEEAPAIGGNLQNRTSIEGFLRSAGLSDKQASEEVRKLFASAGDGNGGVNWNKLNGLREGQVMTTADLEKYKSPSVYLLDLAEKAREAASRTEKYQDKLEKNRERNESIANMPQPKLPQVAFDALAGLNRQPTNVSSNNNAPIKKIVVELKSGAGTVDAEIPLNQEAIFNAFIKQLGESRAIAGQ